MNLVAEARDHAAAGSLAEELPYWGWLPDNRTCLTRGGQLLSLGRLTAKVADGQTAAQLDRVLDRWQRALSNLDERTRFYFYFLRRPVGTEPAPEGAGEIASLAAARRSRFLNSRVSDIRTCVAWSTDARLKRAAASAKTGWKGVLGQLPGLRQWTSWRELSRGEAYFHAEIEAVADRFRQQVDSSRTLLDDLTPIRILAPHEASAFLSELINRPGTPWNGFTGSGLNWRLAVSELEAERRHLRLDGEDVVLYSLLSPPVQGHANLLAELYRLDATLTVSLEWRRQTQLAARKKIRSAQRHYFAKRFSLMAHMQEKESTDAALEDSAATAEVRRLDDALVELDADGIAYGEVSLTVALHGDLSDLERMDGEVRRIFDTHDAKVIREGYGQLPAWFCRLPGQPPARQARTVPASSGAAACLAPLYGPPVGQALSKHLAQPSLAVLETRWKTPYHYDLFAGDVGHTLVLGATGAGKSFLLNFLLVQALRYNPRILILDLGGSYRWLTRFLGGGYLHLSPGEDGGTTFRLRPFGLPPTRRTFQFLAGWLTRLLRIGGYQTTGEDLSEIRKRVEDLYQLPPERRSFGTLVPTTPATMWPALDRWHGQGAWAPCFDNPAVEEDLKLSDWQVIDLAGAAEHEDLCEAALFYLLERMRLALEDPAETTRVKLMVVDEAWRYLRDPAVLAYLAEAAKTWRKKNAALVMATQSAVDVTGTPGAEALLESMPTKLFLANPDLPDSAAAAFRLNEEETDLVRMLIPKRELYLRRPAESGILRLDVDPESYWIYTSSPRDAERRARAVEQHGLARALQVLSQGAPS